MTGNPMWPVRLEYLFLPAVYCARTIPFRYALSAPRLPRNRRQGFALACLQDSPHRCRRCATRVRVAGQRCWLPSRGHGRNSPAAAGTHCVQRQQRARPAAFLESPVMNPVIHGFNPTIDQQPCQRGVRAKDRTLNHLLLPALYGASLALPAAGPALADELTPLLPPSFVTSTTIPADGDVNPYGVAFVP